MHAKVFSIQIFKYLRQIPPRVCTLVLFIITVFILRGILARSARSKIITREYDTLSIALE